MVVKSHEATRLSHAKAVATEHSDMGGATLLAMDPADALSADAGKERLYLMLQRLWVFRHLTANKRMELLESTQKIGRGFVLR